MYNTKLESEPAFPKAVAPGRRASVGDVLLLADAARGAGAAVEEAAAAFRSWAWAKYESGELLYPPLPFGEGRLLFVRRMEEERPSSFAR
jgi:hypothetical protein